jgi:hypothetical protein
VRAVVNASISSALLDAAARSCRIIVVINVQTEAHMVLRMAKDLNMVDAHDTVTDSFYQWVGTSSWLSSSFVKATVGCDEACVASLAPLLRVRRYPSILPLRPAPRSSFAALLSCACV